MKKAVFFPLALFLGSSSAQDIRVDIPFAAWPLIGQKMCGTPDIIFDSTTSTMLLEADKADIKQSLENKFSAYRLSGVCNSKDKQAYSEIRFSTSDVVNDVRSVVVTVEAYRFDPDYGGILILWNSFSFGGIKSNSSSFWKKNLLEGAGKIVDQFAADYAKANP